MKHRAFGFAFLVTVGSSTWIAACGGTGASSAPGEDVGQATAAISAVPSMVGCVEIDVTGARAVTRRFDVTPGTSPVLQLTGLPLGADTFVGLAYPSACESVTSAMQATWISDPVGATLVAQQVDSVALTLRPNGQASVGVGFQGDEAGATCDATSCPNGCCASPTGPCNNSPTACGAGGGTCVDCTNPLPPNATGATCTPSGQCQITACAVAIAAVTVAHGCTGHPAVDYADCDQVFSNGCETVADTTSNCGGCGFACAAGQVCGDTSGFTELQAAPCESGGGGPQCSMAYFCGVANGC